MARRARLYSLLTSVFMVTQLAGCAASHPADGMTHSFEVPYFTNRQATMADNDRVRYSAKPSTMSAGACRFTRHSSQRERIRLESYEARPVEAVLENLDVRRSDGVLVYIHGYNIGFKRACKDAAKLAARLGYEDRLVLLSWPAGRAGVTYRGDERRMDASLAFVTETFAVLSSKLGGSNIDVIAHSMGSRAVGVGSTPVPPTGEPFNNLILVAPDIDRDAFLQSLTDVKQGYRDISVLATDRDFLLRLSQTVNGNARLGRAVDLEVDEVTVVDVSDYEGLGLGKHEYHLHSEAVGRLLNEILAD